MRISDKETKVIILLFSKHLLQVTFNHQPHFVKATSLKIVSLQFTNSGNERKGKKTADPGYQ
jgi:hypothetical protein